MVVYHQLKSTIQVAQKLLRSGDYYFLKVAHVAVYQDRTSELTGAAGSNLIRVMGCHRVRRRINR